jgi:trk system potassium uptake protein TrkA
VGATLAYRLCQKGHEVTVVDQSAAAFNSLHPNFRGRTIEGEVLSRDVLHRAGIEKADGLAAVTNSDATNAVVARVAQEEFHVPNVVVRNYDPRWRPVLEAFDLQIISSASWGAQRIEEMLTGAVLQTVFSAGNGEVEIYEYHIPEAWAGQPVHALFEGQCRAISITRAGKAMFAECDMPLETGDIVHFSATYEGIERLRERLASRPQQAGGN